MSVDMLGLNKYTTIVFDCDGVVLDSNKVKTEAFHKVAYQFGKEAADKLVAYHVENGGISRYKKFQYLVEDILGRNPGNNEITQLSNEYGESIYNGLLECNVTPGLDNFRKNTESMRWLIVSGGDQEELRQLFKLRGLYDYFDTGIYGSPRTKSEILNKLLMEGKITKPALFLGDSTYDHRVASKYEFDFIFVNKWTEFSGWSEYCKKHNIYSAEYVKDLLVL